MSLEEHSGLQMTTWLAAILILACETPAENPVVSARTSDLQNPELTNGCFLKPPSLWSSVIQQEKANVTG